MHTFKNLFLIVFIISVSGFAQKNFTLKQVILEAETISPLQLEQLHWIPETEEFSYIQKLGDNAFLISEKIEAENKTQLTSLSKLNKSLTEANLNQCNQLP